MRGAYAYLGNRGDCLELRSSYSPELVAELKAQIPAGMRRFEPDTKAWLIAPAAGAKVAAIVQQCLGIHLAVPANASTQQAVTRLVRLEYLGAAKDRGDGSMSAMGYDGSEWALVFGLDVLKRWFCEDDARPDEAPTLYAALGIKSDADEGALRSAYRRAARTYHPDINKEPDAADQFKRIQRAYEVLRDENMRARYDAGLKLARAVTTKGIQEGGPTWKPPLRCGLLLVTGTEQLGRIVVSRIIEWRDVTNEFGQVLVTSWPMGATQPTRRYV